MLLISSAAFPWGMSQPPVLCFLKDKNGKSYFWGQNFRSNWRRCLAFYICTACQAGKKDNSLGVAGIKKHFKRGHLVQPHALRQACQSI